MKGSQIHFWAKMGLGKFGWGKNGTGQIWVGANLALGKFGFWANLAGQTWAGQKWLDTGWIVAQIFFCPIQDVSV